MVNGKTFSDWENIEKTLEDVFDEYDVDSTSVEDIY